MCAAAIAGTGSLTGDGSISLSPPSILIDSSDYSLNALAAHKAAHTHMTSTTAATYNHSGATKVFCVETGLIKFRPRRHKQKPCFCEARLTQNGASELVCAMVPVQLHDITTSSANEADRMFSMPGRI